MPRGWRAKPRASRAHHVSSMELRPNPTRPERAARLRRKSVRVPRTKKSTGTQNEIRPLTAKNVKNRFSTIRSPKISSCAPRGDEQGRVCAQGSHPHRRAQSRRLSADGDKISDQRLAEKREQRNSCERGADAHDSYLVRSHAALPLEDLSRARHRERRIASSFTVPAAGPPKGKAAESPSLSVDSNVQRCNHLRAAFREGGIQEWRVSASTAGCSVQSHTAQKLWRASKAIWEIEV